VEKRIYEVGGENDADRGRWPFRNDITFCRVIDRPCATSNLCVACMRARTRARLAGQIGRNVRSLDVLFEAGIWARWSIDRTPLSKFFASRRYVVTSFVTKPRATKRERASSCRRFRISKSLDLDVKWALMLNSKPNYDR